MMGDRRHTISHVASKGPVSGSADTFLPAVLVAAMASGHDVRIEGPVSARLLASVPEIQRTLVGFDRRSWHLGLRMVSVEADGTHGAALEPDRGVGALFSGGIDSFYTALQHLDEITELVSIRWLGVEPKADTFRERILDGIREAAGELDRPLMEVRSTLRLFSRAYVGWGELHGAGMASVGLLLAPRFRKLYVPGWLNYTDQLPYGSHPALDPLWSTEDVEVVYDGTEATRHEKVERLADSDVARRWLQVCNDSSAAYNCGKCRKCLWTMTSLEMVGALGDFRQFPATVDLERLSSLALTKPHIRLGWEATLRAVERAGSRPDLAAAIRSSLARRRKDLIQRAARRLGRRSRPRREPLRKVEESE